MATATSTLTAANGDTIVLALEFQTTFVSEAEVTFAGSYTVAGGTGRFAGAQRVADGLGVGEFTLTLVARQLEVIACAVGAGFPAATHR